MTKSADPSVSLLARLRNIARQQGLPVDTMLLLYTQQGFLARLDRSPHSEQFVVKGGMSLYTRYRSAARPTQDLDLAARHLPNTPEGIREALTGIVMQPFPDSLTFDPADISPPARCRSKASIRVWQRRSRLRWVVRGRPCPSTCRSGT